MVYVRPVMLIPVDSIPGIMTNLPAGFYTYYTAFYDNFLATPLGCGVAAVEQRYTPLAQSSIDFQLTSSSGPN